MFQSTDIIACLGMRGCGKTYLSRWIQSLYPRKVIIDSLNEYEETANTTYDITSFFNVMLANEHNTQFEIIFKNDIENKAGVEIFNELVRVVYYRGSTLLCIDEIQLFSDVGHYGLCEWLENYIFIGRHAGAGLIFSTQRIGMLNKNILSQCSHVFIGYMHEFNDIKNICNFTGLEPDQISNLQLQEFIHWQPRQIPNKVKLINNVLTKI